MSAISFRKQKQKSSCWITVRSLGIFREQWLADYYRLKRPALAAWCEARAEQQQIIVVHVEKLGNLWLHADLLPLLERALAGKLTAALARYFRLLILLSGIANARSSFLILATGWSAISQRRNASMAILFCRYYIVGN